MEDSAAAVLSTSSLAPSFKPVSVCLWPLLQTEYSASVMFSCSVVVGGDVVVVLAKPLRLWGGPVGLVVLFVVLMRRGLLWSMELLDFVRANSARLLLLVSIFYPLIVPPPPFVCCVSWNMNLWWTSSTFSCSLLLPANSSGDLICSFCLPILICHPEKKEQKLW